MIEAGRAYLDATHLEVTKAGKKPRNSFNINAAVTLHVTNMRGYFISSVKMVLHLAVVFTPGSNGP